MAIIRTDEFHKRNHNSITMTHKIQVYKGKKGGWYIRIIARNGKIVADGGEPYANSGNAKRAAKRLMANIYSAKIEVI